MKKHILIAATAALLVLPSLPATVFAASSETFGNAEGHHPKFSQEDFAAFTDARIAALKAGLKLTPAQEKNWPALEATLRDQANARAARMAEWHQKTGELSEHRSVIEGLEQGAKRLAARSAEMEKLADAAKPLTTASTMHRKAASGSFFAWPPENIGITDPKASVTASISMGCHLDQVSPLLRQAFDVSDPEVVEERTEARRCCKDRRRPRGGLRRRLERNSA